MTDLSIISRRHFVIGAAGAVSATAFAQSVLANGWEEALSAMTGGDAYAEDGLVDLSMPEIAENGNVVPFEVTVDSPMTADSHVTQLTLVATGNPTPDIASYTLSPAMGEATISSRMRLGKTQDIVAVAKMNDGSLHGVKTTVKVTIGGCGG